MGRCPLAGSKARTVPNPPPTVKQLPLAALLRVRRRAGRPSRRSGFLVALVLATADRSAKDVAEAGAGVRRAELGHRPLLLIDFAGLDRRGDLAGRTVDRGDLGIDPFADGKAVGPLLAAVARQLGLADKAGDAVADCDL